MKIKSIIDIITNSSTEVFIYYNKDLNNKVISFIDNLLQEIGSNFKCKDLFEVKMLPSKDMYYQYGDIYKNKYINTDKYPENPSEEQLMECIKEYPNLFLKENYFGYTYPEYDGIQVKALNPKHKVLARQLEDLINNNFECEAFRDD